MLVAPGTSAMSSWQCAARGGLSAAPRDSRNPPHGTAIKWIQSKSNSINLINRLYFNHLIYHYLIDYYLFTYIII